MVLHNLAGKDTVNHFCFCKYFSRDDVFGAGMRFSKFKRLMVVAMFLFSRQGLIAQGNTNKELADSGTNSNNQSNQLSGYRLNDLVKPGASSIDWSNAFQEVMNDSTIFYSRLGISTGVTVPFINAPFQLNQFIYYNNITGVDFSFDNFKFSFDKNKFSEEQRKKVQVSLLDSLYIDTLKLLEDTLKTFEDLRLRVSGEGFISDKMLFTKRIKEMQDSLSMGFQIDTAAFLAYQNKQTEIKQIESDYRSFFEKKKKYQQQVYDGRKRVEQKVAQYKHLDSKEVLNELESKKMLSLSEKILSNLQSLEIGKCNIRYNSFFLQNLPIRGFYTTYLTRKNIYLSAASGKEVSYFYELYNNPNYHSVKRNIHYARAGLGNMNESHIHVSLMDYKSNNTASYSEAPLYDPRMYNGVLLSIESQYVSENRSTTKLELLHSTDFSKVVANGKEMNNYAVAITVDEKLEFIKGSVGVNLAKAGNDFYNPFIRILPPGAMQMELSLNSKLTKKLSLGGAVKKIFSDELHPGKRDVNIASVDIGYAISSSTQTKIKYIRSDISSQVNTDFPEYSNTSQLFLLNLTTRIKIAGNQVLSVNNMGYNIVNTDFNQTSNRRVELILNTMESVRISDLLNPSLYYNVISSRATNSSNNYTYTTYNINTEISNSMKVGKKNEIMLGYGYLLNADGYSQSSFKTGITCVFTKNLQLSATGHYNYSLNSIVYSKVFLNTNMRLIF